MILYVTPLSVFFLNCSYGFKWRRLVKEWWDEKFPRKTLCDKKREKRNFEKQRPKSQGFSIEKGIPINTTRKLRLQASLEDLDIDQLETTEVHNVFTNPIFE